MRTETDLPVRLRTIEYRTTGLAMRLELLVQRIERLAEDLHQSPAPTTRAAARMLDKARASMIEGRDDLDEIAHSLAMLEELATPSPRITH